MTLMAQEIVDAALREFKAAPHNGSRDGNRRRQLHVDFRLLAKDMDTMSLEEYNTRITRPAMQGLADLIPEDVIFLKLKLPTDVKMAAESDYLRFVADEIFAVTECDEITGVATKCDYVTVGRFDVMFELA